MKKKEDGDRLFYIRSLTKKMQENKHGGRGDKKQPKRAEPDLRTEETITH